MALQDIEAFLNSVEITVFERKAEYWVDIIHIANPHDFYARLTTHREAVRKIERISPVSKPLTVKLSDTVLFNVSRDPENPKYVRGKVTGVEQAGESLSVDIFAIDYGYKKKNVIFDRLWTCDKSILSIPALAMNCRLANCAPKSRDGSWGGAIEAFKYYVGKERAKIIIEDITRYNLVVTLINSCPDDLATLLTLTDYTTLGYVHNAVNFLQPSLFLAEEPKTTISNYKFKKLNINDTVHVRVVSGETLQSFYVADLVDYKTFVDERRSLVVKEPPLVDRLTVKSGDLVCVWDFYDKYYKRAVIKKIFNEKADLQYVDTGKDETLSLGYLRQIPEEYLSKPVVGIFCSLVESQLKLKGLNHYENVARLLHPGRDYIVTVVKSGHEFSSPNIVKINDIQKYLYGGFNESYNL